MCECLSTCDYGIGCTLLYILLLEKAYGCVFASSSHFLLNTNIFKPNSTVMIMFTI